MERDSNHVEHQEPKSAGTVQSSMLPSIPYDEKVLQELVDTLQNSLHSPEKSAQLSGYISEVHQKILKIKGYQAKGNLDLFRQAMLTELLEIKGVANAIRELTKFSDLALSNTVKQKILEWIKPLEDALKRRGRPNFDELALKTKHLCAEQSFVSRQPNLRQALMQHLGGLKQLLLEPGKAPLCCYISYAWPSEENKTQEYWVQPFLYVLYDHLKAAGIRVVMDIRDNKPGENIYKFMEQYHEGNYIILIGTESLLQKHYGVAAHAVQTELSIILSRFEQDQRQFGQNRIYPMLISGTLSTAYPERYQLYTTVRDARDQGYFRNVKKINGLAL